MFQKFQASNTRGPEEVAHPQEYLIGFAQFRYTDMMKITFHYFQIVLLVPLKFFSVIKSSINLNYEACTKRLQNIPP